MKKRAGVSMDDGEKRKRKTPNFFRNQAFWQRMRDSNPRKRSQSPVCYRYTNPLDLERSYYTQFSENVKLYFSFFTASRIWAMEQSFSLANLAKSSYSGFRRLTP